MLELSSCSSKARSASKHEVATGEGGVGDVEPRAARRNDVLVVQPRVRIFGFLRPRMHPTLQSPCPNACVQ